MYKKFVLLVMVLAIPLTAMAKVNRLLTVDTPYVDYQHVFKVSLVSFRPLDMQLNLRLFKFLDISANTSPLLWAPLFIDLGMPKFGFPNFGAKVAIQLPIIPLTIGASVNYIAFKGKEAALMLLQGAVPPEITINDISLNFNAARWDIMAALDLKLIRLYGTMDFQVFGLEGINTNSVSSYFHPTVGADIQLGNILAIFAEIGYYIQISGVLPQSGEISGAMSLVNPSDFTAGLGVELDLAFINIRAGVQYPGASLTLDPNNAANTTYATPVIPYVNLSLQF